ncbi:MAG: hypothetical protein ACE366_23425 [Bradymonadia bacterium]
MRYTRPFAVALGLTLPLFVSSCDVDALTGEVLDGSAETDTGALDASVPDPSAPDASSPTDASLADSGTRADADRPAEDTGVPTDAEPPVHEGPPTCPAVVIEPPPESLGLDPFYTQYVDVRGLPLVGGPGVPEDAFRVAAYTLEQMLVDQPCARVGLAEAHVRFGIMGPDDVTTDMPEYSDFYEAFPGTDWDNRGRGFGATLTRPLTTGAVENLLQDPTDPWVGENIFLHEVAHSVFEFGVEGAPDGLEQRDRLEALYQGAMTQGLWRDTYAATNANEYWAEGVQNHFDNNLSADPPNGVHNFVDTREELTDYDPDFADFIAEHMGTRRWPAYCNVEGPSPAWVPPPIPDLACPQRVRLAENTGCDVQVLRSQSSELSASVMVVNQTLQPMTLHWIDFEGARAQAYDLGPRNTITLNSFATHGWLLTDADGVCRGGFVTAEEPTRFIIR